MKENFYPEPIEPQEVVIEAGGEVVVVGMGIDGKGRGEEPARQSLYTVKKTKRGVCVDREETSELQGSECPRPPQPS